MTSAASRGCLIVSSDVDPHVDAVLAHSEAFDINAVRIDTKFANRDLRASIEIGPSTARPRVLIGSLADQHLHSIWYRRPRPPLPHSDISDERFRPLSSSEMRAFLQNLYRVSNCKVLPAPWAIREADNKLVQLSVANRIGFSVPRTLVTNDPAELLEFSKRADVCIKSLAAYHWNDEHDVEFALRSARVSGGQISRVAEEVRLSPTLFQEYVPKKYEWRVTVVNSEVFACRMNTQSVVGAEEDWRIVDFDLIEHELLELPLPLTEKILAYLNHFGLNFGAFDFIETPDGQMIFLECNPNGQWLWVEMKTGAQISLAIAKYIFG